MSTKVLKSETMTFISVVLPFNRVDDFLTESVYSLLANRFCTFEILLIADSISNSNFSKLQGTFKDPRVRLVKSKGTGLVEALNTGIESSTGEFVARMDSDDIALPIRLERQLKFLAENPRFVAVGSQVEYICPHGTSLGFSRYPKIIRGTSAKKPFSSKVAHPSVMVRKRFLTEAGGYRPEFQAAEDLDLWNRLLRIGDMANINETLLRYRLHNSQFSVTRGEQMRHFTHLASALDIAEVFGAEDLAKTLFSLTTSEKISAAISEANLKGIAIDGRLRLMALNAIIKSELHAANIKSSRTLNITTRGPVRGIGSQLLLAFSQPFLLAILIYRHSCNFIRSRLIQQRPCLRCNGSSS